MIALDHTGGYSRGTSFVGGGVSFRFSAKYTDPESGLLYYGYRYYQPSSERCLSRDWIGEAGQEMTLSTRKPKSVLPDNLVYGLCRNNCVDHFDYLGLTLVDVYTKMRTGRLRKMWGIDVTGAAVPGVGTVWGLQLGFFPDACEVGAYAIANAVVGTEVDNPAKAMFIDMPVGWDLSISANETVAQWRGSGIGNAKSWGGLFYGGTGGFTIVGAGVFWDPKGDWVGASVGVGLSATQWSLRTNPEYYKLIGKLPLAKPLCYCLIARMP